MEKKLTSRPSEEQLAQILPEPIAPDKLLGFVNKVEEIKKKLALEDEIIFYDQNGARTSADKAIAQYVPKKPLRTFMMAFRLNAEILNEQRHEAEDEHGRYYVWRYWVRVSTQTGWYVDEVGACSSRDPFFAKRWNKEKGQYEWIDPDEASIIDTAYTNALNRAISSILGGAIPTSEDVKRRSLEYLVKKAVKGKQPSQPVTYMTAKKIHGIITKPQFTQDEKERITNWLNRNPSESDAQKQLKKLEEDLKNRLEIEKEQRQSAEPEQPSLV